MLSSLINTVLGLPAWLLLVLGIPLLLKCADWLVDGAVSLARQLGCSPLLIGLTVVAFGTSAPELAVNVVAALSDKTDLSFGNVVGSNIANIGLVVGLGAMTAPIVMHSRVIKMELPLLFIVSIAAAVLAVLGNGYGRVVGMVMLGAFVGFCVLWYQLGQFDGRDPLIKEAKEEAREDAEAEPAMGVGRAVALVLIGFAGLVLGGKFTEHGAVQVAQMLGLSNALIGMTIVAVATSLPEAATVIVAARKGHTDLAMGNVIGSNIFNLLLVLAVTAVIRDVPLPDHGWQDLVMMIAMTLLLLIVSMSRLSVVTRTEGALLLVFYSAYLLWGTERELGWIRGLFTP